MIIRWLTAAAIILLCAITAIWGWQVMRFAQARTEAINNPSEAIRLNAWRTVPGLTAEVIETTLRDRSVLLSSPKFREAQLSALVAIRPMSSRAWFLLARERFELDRPKSAVDAAVMMSWLTGPNEGSVMWQRGVFELVRWRVLADPERRLAAADLAGAIGGHTVDTFGLNLVKGVLAEETPALRTEVAKALHVAGLSDADLVSIGLGSEDN